MKATYFLATIGVILLTLGIYQSSNLVLIVTGALLAAAAAGAELSRVKDQHQKAIDLLATEAREAIQDLNLKMNGIRDTVAGFSKDLDLMQKDLVEFENSISADEMTKLRDRIGLVEMKAGLLRTNPYLSSVKKD